MDKFETIIHNRFPALPAVANMTDGEYVLYFVFFCTRCTDRQNQIHVHTVLTGILRGEIGLVIFLDCTS